MPPLIVSFSRFLFWVSPPFVGGLIAIGLSLLDIVTLDSRGIPRRHLILTLFLYWALAAALVAIVLNPRSVRTFVRTHRAQLTGALLSVVVSLAIAEVAARQIVERTRGFRLVPSERMHHRSPPDIASRDNTGAFITTNSDGFRTHWTKDTFRTQRVRVALVGDSFTFGFGVGDDQTAPYFLEHELRRRLGRDDIGVLNAGTISWSPLIQRNAFRELVKDYEPTVTLLLLDVTDVGDDYKYALDIVPGSDPQNPRFVDDTVRTESRFALLQLADPLLAVLRAPLVVLNRFGDESADVGASQAFRLEVGGKIETNRWFVLKHPLSETRPYFEKTLSYLRDIAGDVEAAGSEFVLIVPPRYFQWNDAECPKDWNLGQRKRNEPHEMAFFEFFDEAAKKESFPIVSLLPAFQATDRFPLVLENDAHWNEDGNRFVAETLADLLIERGLVR